MFRVYCSNTLPLHNHLSFPSRLSLNSVNSSLNISCHSKLGVTHFSQSSFPIIHKVGNVDKELDYKISTLLSHKSDFACTQIDDLAVDHSFHSVSETDQELPFQLFWI